MSDNKKLIEEYKESLRLARSLQKRNKNEADSKTISGIISSTEYSLSCLKREERGLHRRQTKDSIQQRTQLWADVTVTKHSQIYLQSNGIDIKNQGFIDTVMSELSERQRECYESIYAKGNTYEETAEMLGITRESVATHCRRAREKIDNHLDNRHIKRQLSHKRH